MKRIGVYQTIIVSVLLMAQSNITSAGSAVSVPAEARDTTAMVKGAAQAVIEQEQLELYKTEAKIELDRAQNEVIQIEQWVEAADARVAGLEAEAELAERDAKEKKIEAEQAQADLTRLELETQAAWDIAKKSVIAADSLALMLQKQEDEFNAQNETVAKQDISSPQIIQRRQTLEDTDELLKLEKEMKDWEQQQRAADAARKAIIKTPQPLLQAVDWSRSEAAYARARVLSNIANDMQVKADQAEKTAVIKAEEADVALEKALDINQAVADARLAAADTKDYIINAKAYALQAQQEYDRLVYLETHPLGSHWLTTELKYYRWNAGSGDSGYQLARSVLFGYWQKRVSYGLFTQYVESTRTSNRMTNKIQGFTDTSLYMLNRNEKDKFIVDFRFNVNMPTGKSSLSRPERYAMMNEDLTGIDQLGKGWQFTPGIEVSRKIGKEDLWTIGTNCIFSQAYDPSSDIANDKMSPGNEWRRFLRWQHAGQKWQFVGEISNLATGTTKISDSSFYNTEDKWEYRLTYNRKLLVDQYLMLYYWREKQDISPFTDTDTMVHYYGAEWRREFKKQNAVFRVGLDIMQADGRRYAGVHYDAGNFQYVPTDVDGRTKYTLGVGYERRINAISSIALDVQAFKMKDGESTIGSPSTTYKGNNVFIRYNLQL